MFRQLLQNGAWPSGSTRAKTFPVILAVIGLVAAGGVATVDDPAALKLQLDQYLSGKTSSSLYTNLMSWLTGTPAPQPLGIAAITIASGDVAGSAATQRPIPGGNAWINLSPGTLSLDPLVTTALLIHETQHKADGLNGDVLRAMQVSGMEYVGSDSFAITEVAAYMQEGLTFVQFANQALAAGDVIAANSILADMTFSQSQQSAMFTYADRQVSLVLSTPATQVGMLYNRDSGWFNVATTNGGWLRLHTSANANVWKAFTGNQTDGSPAAVNAWLIRNSDASPSGQGLYLLKGSARTHLLDLLRQDRDALRSFQQAGSLVLNSTLASVKTALLSQAPKIMKAPMGTDKTPAYNVVLKTIPTGSTLVLENSSKLAKSYGGYGFTYFFGATSTNPATHVSSTTHYGCKDGGLCSILSNTDPSNSGPSATTGWFGAVTPGIRNVISPYFSKPEWCTGCGPRGTLAQYPPPNINSLRNGVLITPRSTGGNSVSLNLNSVIPNTGGQISYTPVNMLVNAQTPRPVGTLPPVTIIVPTTGLGAQVDTVVRWVQNGVITAQQGLDQVTQIFGGNLNSSSLSPDEWTDWFNFMEQHAPSTPYEP